MSKIKMNMETMLQKNLLKELAMFNKDFAEYKEEYMDKDDKSSQKDVAEELLSEVLDIFYSEKKVEEECSICLEKIDNKKNNCKLGCGHEFHFGCILQLNKTDAKYGSTCPLCRIQFDDKEAGEKRMREEGTMQTIHDISIRLPGRQALLIHRMTHLSEQQLITLDGLMDVVEH